MQHSSKDRAARRALVVIPLLLDHSSTWLRLFSWFPVASQLKLAYECFLADKRDLVGVEKSYDTPHTSLSLWALLDEGALFFSIREF